MSDVGLNDLLRAGVHFGHQTRRWNPKMRKYIFAERGGIYLIDLQKTLEQLARARKAIRETVRSGDSVLFVCTKPQLKGLVQSEAERCGAFYVTERWLGGMLTNFQTIKRNIRRLKELERGFEEGSFEYYTKKERLQLDRERQKLERYLEGIKEMTQLPGLVYVVDAKREEIAVKEANRLEIPVVAIADTNADPEMIDVPVPGNDDAIRAVSLITRNIADAVERAKQEAPERQVEAGAEEAYTYSSDAAEAGEEASRRPRSRPRKRRRPRPEVIARRMKGGEEEETEGGGSEESTPDAAAEETPEAAAAEAPEAPDESEAAAAEAEPAGSPASESAAGPDAEASGEPEAGEEEEREKVAAAASATAEEGKDDGEGAPDEEAPSS